MNKIQYYKNFLNFAKENGLEIEGALNSDNIDKIKMLFPLKIFNILFNQEEYLSTAPCFMNSSITWLKIAAIYCLQNPFKEI